MQQPLLETASSEAVSAPGFKVGRVEYDSFGVMVAKPGQVQYDVRKELRNKLAWVIGTCYGVGYSGRRAAAQVYADLITTAVLRDHGYPGK